MSGLPFSPAPLRRVRVGPSTWDTYCSAGTDCGLQLPTICRIASCHKQEEEEEEELLGASMAGAASFHVLGSLTSKN